MRRFSAAAALFLGIYGTWCAAVAKPTSGFQFQEIAQVDSGLVFWHGHRVDPPFHIRVAFEPAADTVWKGVYLGDIPIDVARDRPREVIPESIATRLRIRRAIEAEASEVYRRRLSRGQSRWDRLQAMAAVYRSHRDVVDSATVISDSRWVVYWRGQSWPEYHEIADRPFHPMPRRQAFLSEANFLAKRLRGGFLVFFLASGGELTTTWDQGTLQQIDALRAALGPQKSFLRDSLSIEELRHPRPLPDLIQEAQP